MKLQFHNVQGLEEGIYAVQDILKFEVADNADIIVTAVRAEEEETLFVSLKEGKALIKYGSKAVFFRGLTILCQNCNKDFEVNEKRNFKTNAAMFDMSRNSVFHVKTVKEIMKRMALMGLNMFMLYTEDTYEVEGHEYFGHMRGRYTRQEIKEMESFGEKIGVELVPCIQLLSHLSTALSWPVYEKIRDTHDTLLPDSDDTYQFIDDVLKSLSETFKTRRIHIGMDEAKFLGRGRWLDYHKQEEQINIFCRHLEKCLQIAGKYGFKPMMWSDGFFDINGEHGYRETAVFNEDVIKRIPRGVDHVYWEYDKKDENIYANMINIHKQFSDNVIFAGGIWTWMGPCPAYGKTIATTVPALNACIKNGVKEVIATIWHNGAECPLVTSLLGLTIYAEMDYTGVYNLENIKKRFEFICDICADDILLMEKADHPDGSVFERNFNPTRYMLYNDPLIGLCDYYATGVSYAEAYEEILKDYEVRGQKQGFFYEGFEYYRALIKVLKQKADFGARLKLAYDEKNVEILEILYNESKEIQENMRNLHAVHRKSWNYYNKAFGFEVFDMIYGALESRYDTLRYHLDKMKEDPDYIIEELAEDRLPYTFGYEVDRKVRLLSKRFTKLYSPNVVSTVYCEQFVG